MVTNLILCMLCSYILLAYSDSNSGLDDSVLVTCMQESLGSARVDEAIIASCESTVGCCQRADVAVAPVGACLAE